MKLQTKIALLFVTVTAAVIVVLFGAVYYFAYRFSFEDFYKRLEVRERIVTQTYLADRANWHKPLVIYQNIEHSYLENLTGEKGFIINLKITGGKIPEFEVPQRVIEHIRAIGASRIDIQNMFYAGRVVKLNGQEFITIVQARDPYGLEELGNLRNILLIGFVLSLLVIFGAGQFFSAQALKPIREIISGMKTITAENLHSRLDVGDGRDELAELADTFNDVLYRLETAFETQNNFISNASHELRTPITIIRGEIELLQKKYDKISPDPAAIQSVLTEISKLEHILSSLLTLAQSGFDGKKQHWENIRLDELLVAVKHNVQQIRPNSVISLELENLPDDENRLCVQGNLNLLRLAVSNVVINACKYSGDKPVYISLDLQHNMLGIVVKDLGIGIPEREIARVFDPFFRASNTSPFKGHGVGLPLSLNILKLHHGQINVQSKEASGTVISMYLPHYQSKKI